MKRKDAEPIGALILQMLREDRLEQPLMQHRLLAAWPETVGMMARYTSRLFIKNQVLMVHVNSAACRQELLMRRSELVAELNRKAGGQIITDISFY